MKKKITLYLVFFLVLGIGFSSCVDEKDFDFDRMAQSTVNPRIHLNNLLSTEITMSDFFNLDSIADSTDGLEIVTVNHPDGNYLDFVFNVDTVFKLDIPKLDRIKGINFDIPSISIEDVIGNFYGNFNYPDVSEPMEVITVDIPKIDDTQIIDSLFLKKGIMYIALNSNINHNSSINLKCSGLRNRITNEIFNENLRLSNSNQNGFKVFNYEIDLSKYSLNIGSNSKLNFEYRLNMNVVGAIKPNYDVNINLEFSDFDISYAFGTLGNYNSSLSDIYKIDIFNDSTFSQIFETGKFALETMYLDFRAETNTGVPAVLNLSTVKAYNEKNNTSADIIPLNSDKTIIINPASGPNQIGVSDKTINLNTSVINIIPSKIEYIGNIVLNPDNVSGFEPSNPWIKIKSKLHIPLKAQINDLDYVVELDKIDIGEASDYINSASLILKLTNYFPFSIAAQLYCLDANGSETGQVLDLNSTSSNIVTGANVDNNGKVISPSTKTTKITITTENFNLIKNASKMKLKLILNTSSNGSTKPYIRLNRDSKVSVSLGIDVKANITL
ncbi:MAG: hypothetical protein PHO12_05265 [Bacteroidales bacterium]|nr:hypothetical protein [Bacteroidales bacterium]MDD4685317.1 hypothetical protein [Bacteroidales bacterium]